MPCASWAAEEQQPDHRNRSSGRIAGRRNGGLGSAYRTWTEGPIAQRVSRQERLKSAASMKKR
jgi:hypothetical protein